MPLKEGILPVPDAASPIEVKLFVQGNVVPETEPVKLILPVGLLLQMVILDGIVTVGVGFAVMVNDFGDPLQKVLGEFNKNLGVTVIVEFVGALVALATLNDVMSPFPVDPVNPMEVLLLVQENSEPITEVPKVMFPVASPLHRTILSG